MEGVEIKGMGSGWSWQTCQLYTYKFSIQTVLTPSILSSTDDSFNHCNFMQFGNCFIARIGKTVFIVASRSRDEY